MDGRIRRFSNTLSRVEIFENGNLSYSCEVFNYDDVMPEFVNATRGRRFFFNTEEKVSVFENTRLRVDIQIRFENATC